MNIGELIAEKLQRKYVIKPRMDLAEQPETIANIVNDEVEKVYGKADNTDAVLCESCGEPKQAHGAFQDIKDHDFIATPKALELPNEETGLANCPFDGGKCDIEIVPMLPKTYSNQKLIFVGEIACCNRLLCGARMAMALNDRESLERNLKSQWNRRAPQIPSRESKPSVTLEETKQEVIVETPILHTSKECETWRRKLAAAGRETKTDEEIAREIGRKVGDHIQMHRGKKGYEALGVEEVEEVAETFILAALREKTAKEKSL